MSREIKFRAWHKSGGVMSQPFDLLGAQNANQKIDLCQCVIMQFTGLKDKNGVEIYEGDNLRIQEYGVWRDYHVKDMVSFWLDLYAEFGGFEPDSNTMEVVGNIYENPEMLTKHNIS